MWLASTGVNPGPDSPIEGYVVNSRDVTERKRAEREREREAERLDRFANAVSHDLRNPLNVAQAGVQALREGTGTDDEQVETVADALDRMETFIDDTLALARQGRTIGTTDPVPVAGVAERAWEVVPTEGATLEVADEVVVEADRERLRTVLENLFRNAVEHGGAGVTVRVGVIDSEVRKDLDSEGPKDLDSEGRVGLYVEDDGPGVSEADRERVLEAGYSTAEDGTGFGLAIAKEVVEAHGWGIRLTASEAGGARFELTGVGRAD
ncbi:MAG: HAMP domain-containing sensor histidine kinase [Haloarculaceae archaeon]